MTQEIVVSGTTAAVDVLRDLEDFTEGWLANRRLSENTRDAYRRDVRGWLQWCYTNNIDPLAATFIHVNRYAREREESVSRSSVERTLSGISSWYAFLVNVNGVAANPVAGADRSGRNHDDSPTRCLSPEEVDKMLAAARPGRDQLIIEFLHTFGCRVSELCDLNVEDVAAYREVPVVTFRVKGGKRLRRACPAELHQRLIDYLDGRTRGPLFLGDDGRMTRHLVAHLCKRLAAEAGIADPGSVTPHSLRHAFAVDAHDEGVPLEDVQDAMGHADPRTTRLYQKHAENLDKDPALILAAARDRRRVARAELI